MGRIQVNAYADLEEGSVLEATDNAIRQPRVLLNIIGAYGVAYAQRSFEDQRMGSIPWKPRAVPNIAGIVSDLNSGREPRANRFVDQPTLIDTNTLLNSLAHQVISDEVVEVGTTVPYGETHQLGGESEVPELTEGGRAILKRWMRRQGVGKVKGIIARHAAARQRAGDAYSRSATGKGVWNRALNRLVKDDNPGNVALTYHQRIINRHHGQYASMKDFKAQDPTGHAEYTRSRKWVAEYKRKIRSSGIASKEWAAKVEQIRQEKREVRDAKVSASRERAQEQMAAAKAKRTSLFDTALSLGWLFNFTGMTMKIPARPFLGVPPDMRKEVEAHLGVVIGVAS